MSSAASVTSEALYPALKEGVELHRTAEGGNLLIPTSGTLRTAPRRGAEFVGHETYRVDGYLVDYVALLDGASDRSGIESDFNQRYGALFGPMLASQGWTWATEHPQLVELLEERLDPARSPRVTGAADGFYPLHCTFEIIETCNFACDHCYYQSAPWKKGRISLEQATAIMDKLADNGVRCIELTGGECTIHPQFEEILAYASERFDLVGIISNGYRIGTNAELARSISETPNVMVQISIDAIGERHNSFRKHSNAFDAAVEAVKRLQEAAVVTRLASSISEANLDQVVDLYHLGKSLGVQKHSFAAVAPLGRGCNISDPGAGSREVTAAIEKALRPYGEDPTLDNWADIPDLAETYEEPRNCGAGWRTVAIDYNGDVRACNYSRDSKKFGNVLDDSYRSLFGQQANFLFNNAPSPGGKDCVGCSYFTHCRGCFVKAFMVSETVYPECPWRRHWFPDMPLSLEEDRHEPHSSVDLINALPLYTPEDNPRVCTSCSGETTGCGSCA